MTDKDTKETKKPVSKKKAAPKKKAATKKATPKKATAKKITPKPESSAKKDTATANAAPYVKSNASDKKTEKGSYIIPGILVLTLAFLIFITFFDKEVDEIVAFGDDVSESIGSFVGHDSDEASENDETVAEMGSMHDMNSMPMAEAPSQNMGVPPYPVRPQYNQQRPAWSLTNAPYNTQPKPTEDQVEMISKQKKVYEEAMKRNQEIMQELQNLRISAYKKYQEDQKELHKKMDELRKKSLKIHQEMSQKMKEIYNEYQTI